jgi:simple sugar transport system substrate-binding protein
MGKRLKLRFITCAVDEAFFNTIKQGMRDAADMLEVEAEFTGVAGVDLEGQAEMVRAAVAEGYDGIALNIIHATAFNEVVREAVDKGVPVVAFNVDGTYGEGPHLSSVNQDLYGAGRTLGERAAEHLAEGGKVLITMHDEGISALEDRARGIQEVIAEEKGATWETVVTGIDPEKAAEIIGEKLAADPAIGAVLCTGQADTEGAGLALERGAGERDYYVAGFDLSPEILRLIKGGGIAFTIDQQPYVQGFYPIVQLVLYCRYGIAPSSMDSGASIITRENVDGVMEFSARGYR